MQNGIMAHSVHCCAYVSGIALSIRTKPISSCTLLGSKHDEPLAGIVMYLAGTVLTAEGGASLGETTMGGIAFSSVPEPSPVLASANPTVDN